MILVSKTTRELLLHWDSSDYGSPVSVSMDLRMPQFTIEEVIPTKCYERFHLGNYKNIHNALKICVKSILWANEGYKAVLFHPIPLLEIFSFF